MSKTILDFERPIIDLENKIADMHKLEDSLDISVEINKLEEKVEQLKKNIYDNLTRWQRVQLARHPERPYTLDYIEMMTEDFVELHGDRAYKDDKAIVGGFAKLGEEKVMIIEPLQKLRYAKS